LLYAGKPTKTAQSLASLTIAKKIRIFSRNLYEYYLTPNFMKCIEDSIFTKSTGLIVILLALLAGTGILITPQNINFIVIGALIIVSSVVLKGKLDQIDQNTDDINELTKRLNMSNRLERLEKELAEQRGKLTVVLSKK